MKTPVIATIAGADCSAGAGIQADLKAFTACNAFGLTVITCVVAETPLEVVEIMTLPPAFVATQLRLLLETYPVAALKTGMLPTAAHIVAVAEVLDGICGKDRLPLVVDPVMVASAGGRLMDLAALEVFETHLLPLASIITPNLPEAAALLRRSEAELCEEPVATAKALFSRYGVPILLKGGHAGGDESVDLLVETADHVLTFHTPRIPGGSPHGTGCTLSAALAAWLGHGLDLPEAVSRAKAHITDAIRNTLSWTGGKGVVQALGNPSEGARS